jgi:hypothetical protein
MADEVNNMDEATRQITTGLVPGVSPDHFFGNNGWNDYKEAALFKLTNDGALSDQDAQTMSHNLDAWYEQNYSSGDNAGKYSNFMNDMGKLKATRERVAAEDALDPNKGKNPISVENPSPTAEEIAAMNENIEKFLFDQEIDDFIEEGFRDQDERLYDEPALSVVPTTKPVIRGIPREKYLEMINNIYMSSGAHNYNNPLQPFMYGLDRYGSIRIADNLEFNGPVFITRPRLCLQTTNLRNSRLMAPLDTSNPNSIAFAIRALLDTNLMHDPSLREPYTNSILFDYRNPFMTPLCNAVSSISGLPDMLIETATTQGGLMTEGQQFAIGGDNLHRGAYELQLTFQDVQYGPIGAIFFYWLEYIRCVTRGYMLAYADDIDQQRINYTVSIYMFNLDPSRKYITHWCKCTGCFPRAHPIGAIMNRERNGARVRAAAELSIPFICNIVEYMDHAIFIDFNSLVERYCPTINNDWYGVPMEPNNHGVKPDNAKHPALPHYAPLNFTSLPWVTSDPYGMRLEWRLIDKSAGNDLVYSKDPLESSKSIDMGILELEYYNNHFAGTDNENVKRINQFYYPGFTKEKFDTQDLLRTLRAIEDQTPDYEYEQYMDQVVEEAKVIPQKTVPDKLPHQQDPLDGGGGGIEDDPFIGGGGGSMIA